MENPGFVYLRTGGTVQYAAIVNTLLSSGPNQTVATICFAVHHVKYFLPQQRNTRRIRSPKKSFIQEQFSKLHRSCLQTRPEPTVKHTPRSLKPHDFTSRPFGLCGYSSPSYTTHYLTMSIVVVVIVLVVRVAVKNMGEHSLISLIIPVHV